MKKMKTQKQVLQDNPDYKNLINAVIRQLGGTDYVMDIVNHGVDGGFPGFTYYSDTVPFAMKHRKHIVQLLEEMAEQLGEDVVKMVSGFGVFRNNPMDNDDRKDLYCYLGGGKCKETTIPNLMAWFAAEEVCRMFDN